MTHECIVIIIDRHIREYLSIKPNSADAYKLLAQINESIGEADKALEYYRKSLDLRRHDSDSFNESPRVFSTPKITPSAQV